MGSSMAEYFRPKKDSTDCESRNTRQKDEEIEATRLLGDAKRQDRRQNWSDTDAEREHSKREKDAVDILVPENKRREDHNFVIDLPGQMQFKVIYVV
jgi:hypothetical protein